MNDIQLVEKTVLEVAPIFERVNTDKGIVFAREAEFAIQIITASSYCMSIAKKNPQSVRDAVTNIAAMGVSLNPARKQGYLVPRKGGIQLVISYMGLLDIAIQSGSILWGQAEIVYASDKFVLTGFDKPPIHERDPFAKERGEMVGVYVVVKTRDGDYLTTPMTADDVWAIRERSDAWQKYVEDNSKKCPWVTDEGEMVKKTVIKRAYKTWPKTERLDAAVHHLNTEAEEGITFKNENDDPLDQPTNLGLTPARYKAIREVARATLQLFNEGDEVGAYGECSGITVIEEKEALWKILKPHSACRTALKRLGDEERAAQKRLDAERESQIEDAVIAGIKPEDVPY